MAHLNYDGLKRYDKRTKEYIEEKIKNIKDIDVNKLATKDELNTKADKTELFSGDYNDLQNLPVIPDTTNLATKNELKNHTDNSNIHVTNTEKNAWNNKLDNSALNPYATKTYVTDAVNKATSGITVDLTPYAKTVDVNTKLDTKVDKVVGKSLVDDAEIARLATINNYNDTDIKTSIANINSELANKANKSDSFSGSYNDLTDKPVIPSLDDYAKTADVNTKLDTKVDKVVGKSLVDDAEIARLATINNYDDTDIKNTINNKANTTDLTAHTSDTNIHVTANDKQKWNNKLDNTALNGYATESFVTTKITEAATSGKVDLTGYATTIEVNNKLASKADKTEIPDISNLATKDELSTHTDNSSIHITASEKTAWNNKLDASALTGYATETFVTTKIAEAATSGKVDLTGYAKTADVNASLSNKVDKVSGKSLISDAEITRLSKISNYDDSSIKTSIANMNSELSKKANKSELFSGSYNDLTDKPAIPNVTGKADKTYVDTELAKKANKSELFSGSYNDLSDKPVIPSLDGYATKTYVTDEINKASLSGGKVDLSGYAKTADLNAHTSDNVKHITSAERTKWSKVDNKIDKTDITTTIDSTSTDTQVPSAKSIYYNCVEGIEINQTTIDTYGTEILKYPLGIWRISSNSIASQFTDLPCISGGIIKITSIDSNTTINPWNRQYSYRVYNFETYMTGNYIRKIESGDTAGVINDTDWQKVCTTSDVDTELDTKVDKIDGKGLSTNDYTTDEKTKVGKIVTSGDGSKFLANDGTYKKVSSSSASSAVAERKFKPVFGFDTYWGEMRDTHGNKNQVDLATIKQQIDQCEEMHVDRIICTVHIGWDETTNSLVIAENTDSLLSAISYCNDKNVTIDTVKVHMHVNGTSMSEKDYVTNVIGISTLQSKYKPMLTTICNLFKNTTVTRIIIMNEMWYITDSNLGYSSFINECLNIVKNAGYATGLSMAGFNTNQSLSDAVIQNLDTFYINVYPGISGSGKYITKQEAIKAFEQCDVDLWIKKLKKKYPNKKIVISEMGVNDYWECLACPSSWQVGSGSKTGGYAVDTYITAMMEFFINKHVEIEELWWWYNLYYEPVKETLLNYLGGDR